MPALPTFAFATETNTLIAAKTAAGATPNARRQYSMDRMIKRLKAQGFWSRIDVTKHALWVVGDTDAVSRINVLNPGTHNLAVNGSPTFTAPGTGTVPGWAFPTISDFLDSGIAANSLTQNDVSIGCSRRAYTSLSAASFDMGVQTGASNSAGAFLFLKAAASTGAGVGAAFGANFSPMGASSNYWDGSGLYSISRTSGTGFASYHGSVTMPANTDASTAATSASTLTVGKVNGQPTTCKATINAALVMPGLSAAEMTQLNAIVQTYLDTVEYGDLAINEAGYAPAAPAKFDVVFYGNTLAAAIGANRAVQQGLSACIIGGWRDHPGAFGGMSGNGLGLVDYDVSGGFGGLAFDLVAAARTISGNSTTRNATVGTGPGNLAFQPRDMQMAIRRLLDGARTGGQSVPLYFTGGSANQTLGGVVSVAKTGTTITGLTTVDGRTFTFDHLIDTSEELDVMRLAGVDTILGREAAVGGSAENYNGYQGTFQNAFINQTQIQDVATNAYLPATSGYVDGATAGSGLLYGLRAQPSETVGQADASAMSYIFRLTLNSNQARRVTIPNAAPTGYLASKYELMGRYLAFMTANGSAYTINSLIKFSPTTGTAIDVNNNGGISMNLVGSGVDYTAADSAGTAAQIAAAREAVQKEVESWQRGLLYWLAYSGDARIPAGITSALLAYGFDWRHYLDPHPNDAIGWPSRIYVREHRRLVGDYVLAGGDVTATDGTTPRSVKTISTISYRFDSHPHIRFVDTTGNRVWEEGSVSISQVISGGAANGTDGITPVPYDAYLPKAAQLTNAAATFGLSSTHIAVCAARMEMVTAQAAESLAYAVALKKSSGAASLAAVDYPTLRTAILAAPTTYPANLPQVN